VLTQFYGTDAIVFTATSDSLPGVVRTFQSLSACADDCMAMWDVAACWSPPPTWLIGSQVCTNSAVPGGTRVRDESAGTQPSRFYRVREIH